ncbi:hypothetical protein N0V90_002934 [Kalmusia sp. IMI 367209]|nr:hypothetical protein N0V90_002934 [Kalmusia sp. IMI 367209]
MSTQTSHSYTARHFTLPHIVSSSVPILVFFLCPLSKDTRTEILASFKNGDGRVWPSDFSRLEFAVVPWLRRYEEPDTREAAFELLSSSEIDYGQTYVFIGTRNVNEETVLIGHLYKSKDGKEGRIECAKVKTNRAYKLICKMSKKTKWFPDTIPFANQVNRPDLKNDTRIWGPLHADSHASGEIIGFTWPNHLPKSLKFEKNRPLIISLIHLSDPELAYIYSNIQHDTRYEQVLIANWPADTPPASSAETYQIFERIKPDWSDIAPYGETYGFFVSSAELSGAKRDPKILVARRQKLAASGPQNSYKLAIANSMSMWTCNTQSMMKAWHAAWNPTGGAHSNGVRTNETISNIWAEWTDRTFTGTFSVLTNPNMTIIRSDSDIPVFILQPISSAQESAVRNLLSWDNTPQLINVPNGDGTLAQLMKHLQSPSFLCYNEKHPGNFIAIDARTLSAYDASTQSFPLGDTSFCMGTEATVWHYSGADGNRGAMIAQDDVGYVTGRCTMHAEDDYQQWTGSVLSGMGLAGYVENYRPDNDETDGEGVERWYWDCFDVQNEELNSLVTTMD